MFIELTKDNLTWFPDLGVGYYPVTPVRYGSEYFKKYIGYSNTSMGASITQARVDLVKKYYDGDVLDIGIGSGHFVEKHGNAYGYDINPDAINWLENCGKYRNLYAEKHNSATFWDSLEHIKNPLDAITKINNFIFVSIPIFNSVEAILSSKHFRKDEHYWYFTEKGLVHWFSRNGFDCVEANSVETGIGRSEIRTFVFRKRNA